MSSLATFNEQQMQQCSLSHTKENIDIVVNVLEGHRNSDNFIKFYQGLSDWGGGVFYSSNVYVFVVQFRQITEQSSLSIGVISCNVKILSPHSDDFSKSIHFYKKTQCSGTTYGNNYNETSAQTLPLEEPQMHTRRTSCILGR